jgi:PLD-like domain
VNFRLIDSGWDRVLDEALAVNHASIRIVCPFIKRGVANRILKYGKPKMVYVVTRFSLRDFAAGVSDVSALRLLLENGAQVKGVRNLHAKLYLFGESRAIVTSANLTQAALSTNHEIGFVATDARIIEPCRQYFEKLWSRAGQRLQVAQLADWDRKIAQSAGGMRQGAVTGLNDEGADLGIPPGSVLLPLWVDGVKQSIVKFFGRADNRADRSRQILEEVRRSGSHWACTYPRGKRPRMVQDGATMFMGRLVKEPNDTLIYGRAMALHYEPGRDDATAADLRLRGWKARWPHYVRVNNSEFVRGNLANGISLNELMDVLKADSFASTQRHAEEGEGNRDPHRAYMRKPAVELSPQGAAWLNERLEWAFAKYGRLPPSVLERLDWPDMRSRKAKSAK